MTTVMLTKWGNSIGIRIPAAVLKEEHLSQGDELEIKTDENGVITLVPIQNKQEGWLERFNAIADADSEELLLDGSNDFDEEEWTW